MTDIACTRCDAPAEVVREEKEVQVGARSAEIETQFARCERCGEEFYLPGQLEKAQRVAGNKIRENEGLLRPEEVKHLREDVLGLTQPEFEQLLGVGQKTVTRWENGTVFQHSSTNSLMLAIRDVPGVARYFAERRGVDIERRKGQPAVRLSPGAQSVRVSSEHSKKTGDAIRRLLEMGELELQQLGQGVQAMALTRPMPEHDTLAGASRV